MLIVIKFGGTSVKGGQRIRGAAQLVKKVVADGHQVVVVTSAMGGMTNLLVGMLDRFSAPDVDETQQVSQFLRFAKQLESEHVAAAKEAISRDDLRAEADNALYTERHNLERVLMGSHFLGELTPIAYDFIVSEGERMVVPVLAGSLKSQGVDAVGIGGNGAGIITDQNFGNARPNMQRTREEVRKTLLPLLQQGKVPVIAGFYGRTDQGTKGQGRIAVLGRGGSDYSATLIGASLDADEVWIMTDVDGVKTTDPRLVPAAYTIPEMPYSAASEMAMLGAKVLHQLSVVPCEQQKIPLRIANTFEPEKPGTWLVADPKGKPPAVWALTLTTGALVRLSAAMPGAAGAFASRIFEQFELRNIEILATASARNGQTLLCLLGKESAKRFKELAQREAGDGVDVEIQEPVAVLGIVGPGVGKEPGVLAQVAACLDSADIQPLATLQGASPDSIVVALPDQQDTTKNESLITAMRAMHRELGLG
jgi:aspartate kinase